MLGVMSFRPWHRAFSLCCLSAHITGLQPSCGCGGAVAVWRAMIMIIMIIRVFFFFFSFGASFHFEPLASTSLGVGNVSARCCVGGKVRWYGMDHSRVPDGFSQKACSCLPGWLFEALWCGRGGERRSIGVGLVEVMVPTCVSK
ncbi:hypothetical protein L209DRAFT_147428 [Thermothelomyces heterothallicus CBS 203.75]